MPLVTLQQVESHAIHKHLIVPEVLSEDPHISGLLQIDYPNGKGVFVESFLTKEDASEEPTVQVFLDDSESYSTLMLIDPDAPSREDNKFGPWRHWIVTNIPPGSLASEGQVHTSYLGPGPGDNTGVHRYIFLLYKQNQKQEFEALPSEEKPQRRNFDFGAFAAKHQLNLVGLSFFLVDTTPK